MSGPRRIGGTRVAAGKRPGRRRRRRWHASRSRRSRTWRNVGLGRRWIGRLRAGVVGRGERRRGWRHGPWLRRRGVGLSGLGWIGGTRVGAGKCPGGRCRRRWYASRPRRCGAWRVVGLGRRIRRVCAGVARCGERRRCWRHGPWLRRRSVGLGGLGGIGGTWVRGGKRAGRRCRWRWHAPRSRGRCAWRNVGSRGRRWTRGACVGVAGCGGRRRGWWWYAARVRRRGVWWGVGGGGRRVCWSWGSGGGGAAAGAAFVAAGLVCPGLAVPVAFAAHQLRIWVPAWWCAHRTPPPVEIRSRLAHLATQRQRGGHSLGVKGR